MRLMVVLLVAGITTLAVCSHASNTLPRYRMGDFEIIILTEGAAKGNTSVLIGVQDEQLKRFAPDGFYETANNAFLIRSPKGLTLIDTAPGQTLFDDLDRLGIGPEQIDSVLLTHLDADHIGGMMLDGKPAFPNARVFISEPELAWWSGREATEEKASRSIHKARAVIDAYKSRISTFRPAEIGGNYNAEIVHGIVPIAAFGHTPGHTLYLLESGEDHILFWGALVHACALQIPFPEVAVEYDMDPRAAVLSRLKVLGRVALNNIAVAGAHMPAPGIGKITSDGKSGYIFTPYETDDALGE